MMKMVHLSVSLAAAACLWLAPTQVSADGPLDKLGRGVAGVFLGFLEIPSTMWEMNQQEGLGMAISVGWLKGFGFGIAREFTGLYEILTFPCAGADKYGSALSPAYPWDRFRKPKMETEITPPLAYPAPRGKLILGTPAVGSSRSNLP
jgi:putative exosortase-associated protein (TIGR04073 family)